MRSRLPRWCGALALVGTCGVPFAVAAQAFGQGPTELTEEQVLELETALAQLNFDPGKIDGVIDERTRAAIRLYQDFAALPPDSKATLALLAEVRSVARSFAEMRATRAAEPTPEETPDAAPEIPAELPVPGREPVSPKAAAKEARVEAPSDIPAQALADTSPPAEPSAEIPREAVAAEPAPELPSEAPAVPPTDAPPPVVEPKTEPPRTAEAPLGDAEAPVKAPEPPRKPKAGAAIAERSPPEPEPGPIDPGPTAKKDGTAAGFNIGGVISRLVETGKRADKPAEAGPAPPSAATSGGQFARVPAPSPAPAPTPAPTPGKPLDGYAAFRDAYEAAQAGDFETAVKRYTDAIESKKLTLEHLGDAHFNRANAFYLLGRFDKSIEDYGVAIGAKPTFAGAFYNRGFAYQTKGEGERAVADFRRARDLGLQRLGVRAPDRPPPLR